MNGLVADFKRTAHLVGDIYSFTGAEILREFGLRDFLENLIDDGDDAPTIAVEALHYFCGSRSKRERVFQFGVVTVCHFLHQSLARQPGHPPRHVIEDLLALLEGPHTDESLTGWIDSNFR